MLRLRPCAVCLSPLPGRLGRLWLARRPLGWAVFWAVLGLWSGLAQAADPGAAADDAKEWRPPEPEEQSVLTSDGLDLHYTYYAGVPNKSTAPIILLHAFKSDAASLRPTALFLQELGHAVLAPDLRGHGRSVHGRADDGKPLKLEAKGFTRPGDFEAMVTQDMEAIKRELLRRHNQGELNIEKLAVVGVEMGATIAINWAALDWSWEQLPTLKQGQDACTLVLISPQWNFHGVGIDAALNTEALRSEIAMQIIAGRKHRDWAMAQRIYDHCRKVRPKIEGEGEATLALDGLDTSLADDKLLTMRNLKLAVAVSNRFPSGDPRKFADKDGRLVETKLATFIEWNAGDRNVPWQMRKKAP